MGSILTSHLRATYDAAVNKVYVHGGSEHVQLVNALADPKLTAVYAENQNENSLVSFQKVTRQKLNTYGFAFSSCCLLQNVR